MSYSSFQKLADAYLENEATPTHNPPTVPPTAPELVKLALTYDFTAKIVRLSKQNIGHITGLGNRYLQDRFEYKQVRLRPVEHRWYCVIKCVITFKCAVYLWEMVWHMNIGLKLLLSFTGMYRSSWVWQRQLRGSHAETKLLHKVKGLLFDFSQQHRCGSGRVASMNSPFS